MVGAFFMPEEICFLCPFLRKEVSTVANRIMGITVKIGKDTTKLQTGFLYNSKCRKNKKLYFINVSLKVCRMILKVAIKCYCEKNKGGIIYEKMLVQ